MNISQIKERIEKKQVAIEKAKKLFNKYTANLDDTAKQLIKNSTSSLKTYKETVMPYLDHIYGTTWGYGQKGRDAEAARSNWQKVIEYETQLEKYKTQLENLNAKADSYENMPQIIKDCETTLVNDWDRYDAERKAFLKKLYNEFEAKYPKNSIEGYKEFITNYKYAGYEFMKESEEITHKNNERAARAYIIDLYNRVVAQTGKITDVKELVLNGPALNGIISGENGKVEVETILAGGYNIQRLHCRTLVKPIH